MLILVSLLAQGISSFAAAPLNDNCANASTITISNGGFGLGVFATPNEDMTSATIQFGEPFHGSQVTAGNDKKSIWYKFSIPTHRGIKVELKQPGIIIPQDAAGFTVFKTSTCMPTLADITPAKLTPINKFGSSYNPCLDPGDYFIQVTSRIDSDGPIFIELTTSYTAGLNAYDLKSTAYPFGTLNLGWYQQNFDVGCQTIDSLGENCAALGANFAEYTQSTWMTFNTDAHIDYFRIEN